LRVTFGKKWPLADPVISRSECGHPRFHFCPVHHTTPSILLATTFISYHILPRLSLAALTLPPLQSRRLSRHRSSANRHRTRMRPPVYLALCLLSASSSEATLISRTANRIHHAAVKRSARLARDIRSVLNNVLIEQPIIGPDTGNRVYCVANPTGPAQNPTSSTPTPTGGGNGVIVSSISSGSSSSRRPSPTPSSAGGPVPTPTSDWKLVEDREGASFFDGWDFWDLPGAFFYSFGGNRSLITLPRPHQWYDFSPHQSLYPKPKRQCVQVSFNTLAVMTR